MSELTPDMEALLDKGFGSPGAPSDKAETAPAPTFEAPAPTETSPESEPQQIGSDVIMMRADYTKKMMALAEERKRYQDYAALDQRLQEDAELRARWDRVMSDEDPGQAAAPGQSTDLEARLRALETSLRQRTIADQQGRQQAHYEASVQALDRVREEFQLSDKDAQDIYTNAIDVGALHYGVPKNRLYDVLSMAAARHVLPRARSDGQRTLLEQMKDKGRTASPARETALPPAPEPDVTKMSESAYEKFLIGEYEKAQRGKS